MPGPSDGGVVHPMTLSIGIDPGASGAIACYSGSSVTVVDMPTVRIKRGFRMVNHVSAEGLAALIRSCLAAYGVDPQDCEAFVEKVGAMPGQGVSSMFAFGRAAGVIEGVLAGVGIPCTLVTPQTWMGYMALIKKGKDGTRAKAMALFPQCANLYARKKDDGRADATMLAVYGYTRIPRGEQVIYSAMGDADVYVESCLEKDAQAGI